MVIPSPHNCKLQREQQQAVLEHARPLRITVPLYALIQVGKSEMLYFFMSKACWMVLDWSKWGRRLLHANIVLQVCRGERGGIRMALRPSVAVPLTLTDQLGGLPNFPPCALMTTASTEVITTRDFTLATDRILWPKNGHSCSRPQGLDPDSGANLTNQGYGGNPVPPAAANLTSGASLENSAAWVDLWLGISAMSRRRISCVLRCRRNSVQQLHLAAGGGGQESKSGSNNDGAIKGQRLREATQQQQGATPTAGVVKTLSGHCPSLDSMR